MKEWIRRILRICIVVPIAVVFGVMMLVAAVVGWIFDEEAV